MKISQLEKEEEEERLKPEARVRLMRPHVLKRRRGTPARFSDTSRTEGDFDGICGEEGEGSDAAQPQW